MPSLARSVPKPLSIFAADLRKRKRKSKSKKEKEKVFYSYSSKYLGKLSGRRYSIKVIEGIFGVGEKCISVHKNFHVSLLSGLHLIFKLMI